MNSFEISENTFQVIAMFAGMTIAGIVGFKYRSRRAIVLSCAYASFMLGTLFYTLHMNIIGDIPRIFYVSDISWMASYLFLLLLMSMRKNKSDKPVRFEILPAVISAVTFAISVYNEILGPSLIMSCGFGIIAGGIVYYAALNIMDEEEAGIGTESLIKTGPEATYAVIGEPTKLEIALGHKGLEWIEISFKGKKVHGGAQKDGVNAIMMAGRFLHKLETEYLPKLEKRTHPVLGTATLNIGTITGGDQPSTVADKSSIRLDRRCLTDETIAQVYEELQAICDELHEEDPKFEAEIRDVFNGETMPHIPFCTDENSPLVKAAENALGREGMTPVLTCFPAWSDAGFMNALTKSECIVLGPGDLSVAHSIHEKISKRQLLSAVSVYEEMAREICKTVWT